MKITLLQIVYGLASIVGLVVTWYFNLQIDGGGFASFISDLYVNSASSSIANDLFVVVFTFLVWSSLEIKRLGMPLRLGVLWGDSQCCAYCNYRRSLCGALVHAYA